MAHVYLAVGLGIAVVGVGLYHLYLEHEEILRQRRMRHMITSSSSSSSPIETCPPSYEHAHTAETIDLHKQVELAPPSYDDLIRRRRAMKPDTDEAKHVTSNGDRDGDGFGDEWAHIPDIEGEDQEARHLACGRLMSRSSHLQRLLRTALPTFAPAPLPTLVSSYLLTTSHTPEEEHALLDAIRIRHDILNDDMSHPIDAIHHATITIQNWCNIIQQEIGGES